MKASVEEKETRRSRLKEVFLLFLKLGFISFGGPAAHIGLMEEEVVNRRKWMSRDHFLDLVGATNLIPGPNSTELTMHCGHERAGLPGLFVAGFSFIIPAAFITGVFAWLYSKYGALPSVEPFIFGIKPAVLSIIAAAIFRLGRKAIKGIELTIIGILVLISSLLGINEIMALMAAGIIGTSYFMFKSKVRSGRLIFIPFGLAPATGFAATALSSMKLFWIFLKIGALLYGSGYVLFAYIDAELVEKGWLTTQQLIDAVAVGQFTPGPLSSTATFIGYQIKGFWGAVGATAGIFLPSFVFVWILNPLVPRMRKSVIMGHFLDCVNIAAVAVMASVLFHMGAVSITNWQAIVIAVAGFAVTFGLKKINPAFTIIGGAFAGYILNLLF